MSKAKNAARLFILLPAAGKEKLPGHFSCFRILTCRRKSPREEFCCTYLKVSSSCRSLTNNLLLLWIVKVTQRRACSADLIVTYSSCTWNTKAQKNMESGYLACAIKQGLNVCVLVIKLLILVTNLISTERHRTSFLTAAIRLFNKQQQPRISIYLFIHPLILYILAYFTLYR